VVKNQDKRLGLLAVVLAAATAVVAAIGVFARGNGDTVLVTNLRGEIYPMITRGIYAFNAERIVAEGVGWDFFTLFFAVPALLACAPWLARGSFRGRLVALGLFAYLFYQYFMYELTWAFGPLYLAWLGVAVLALFGIVFTAALIAREPIAERFSDRFPRLGVSLLSTVLAFVLVMMWLVRIVALHRGDYARGMLLGQTTMVVPALDLTLVVPLACLTAITAYKRRPVGFVLASVFVVKAIAMASAICAMLVQAWRVEGTIEIFGFVFFGSAALASFAVGAAILRSIEETQDLHAGAESARPSEPTSAPPQGTTGGSTSPFPPPSRA
jgi:hypothetical protein